ncbi:MAG: site-2 protease family protein [Anaerolineales bacterium]|nr:site-2 protease family protein [Anaerolineales bacterium]
MSEYRNVTESPRETLLQAVRAVMDVETVTTGGPGDAFAYRFSGRLILDSIAAYDQLQPEFEAISLRLLFREKEGQHLVLAMPGLIRPQPSRSYINIILFFLTLASMLFSGALSVYDGPLDLPPGRLILAILRQLDQGISFALSLIAILFAHEFGHYLAARKHRTAVTLPFFIPFPGSPFGTMGAFIQLKEPPKNKRVLLDIGLAGPLAGLAVAIPILCYGLSLSPVDVLPPHAGLNSGQVLEGNSILYLALKFAVKGEMLPGPLSYNGVHPMLYWIRYVLLGFPLPFGGRDLFLHPIAWAGWAGLLVTSLNLIPAGQLDGGHVLYVLFGQRARLSWPVIVGLLILLGTVWSGWYLWAALIFLLGRTYAQPLDDITILDPRRRALAIVGLVVALLVFIPVPLIAL